MRIPVRPVVTLLLAFFIFESYRISTIVAPVLRYASNIKQQQQSATVIITDSIDEVGTVKSEPEVLKPKIDDEWKKGPEREKVNFLKSVLGKDVDGKNVVKQLWKEDWSSLSWVKDQSLFEAAKRRQQEFLQDPVNYRPRPFLYRPILGGMGWGNLMYDISHHIIFALMLERPFVMMLDKKDAKGKLGWNEETIETSVLRPRVIDWKWGQRKLLEVFPPAEMTHNFPNLDFVTCRKGHAFHDTCGGDQDKGNFEPLLDYFKRETNRSLYSEYSASFIRPLQNSRTYSQWISDHLAHRSRPLNAQLRFAFSFLFQVNPRFRLERVFPHLRDLTHNFTRKFVTVHVRTGHMETGVPRDASLGSDMTSLQACHAQEQANRTWLVLTDNAQLASRAASELNAYVTISHANFSLQQQHVGYTSGDVQANAWEVSLRDWLLIVESTGPVLLRSRMPSAFSYGQRGALIGGMSCNRDASREPLVDCGSRFFDEACLKL